MSAIDEIYAYYVAKDASIGDDIDFHARHGHIVFSPEFCIMARPVSSQWTDEDITGFRIELTQTPDCWHIHIASGDLKKVLDIIPYQLPYVSFQRNGGELRRYKLNRFTHGIRKTKSSSFSRS